MIENNVRLPDLVLGDLDAQYATCRIGERELLAAARALRRRELEAYFDRLLDYGEALTRKAIAGWPDGTYRFTDYIDGDGFSPDADPDRLSHHRGGRPAARSTSPAPRRR